MKLHVIAYGCQMSEADGTEMSRPLLERGFTRTSELSEADAVILNTCTVRQHAEDRAVSAIGRLREWKEERPERFLIVAGCAAERIGGWLSKRFPFVDLVVGARSLDQYPRLLEEALRRRFDWLLENEGAWGEDSPQAAPSPVSAFLTVMRGCNYSCSYCIVPSVRGRESYLPFDRVLEEARRLAEGGARELMLLGQTVNSYRDPGGRGDFADLLRAVAAVPGVLRLRFMSPHPFFVNERMARAMAETPQVCRHLHLPAQSGSDPILKAMRRNYTRAELLSKTAELRRQMPDLELSSDFIVGFPGETEEDFALTLTLAGEMGLSAAYCFKYSPREGTPAFAAGDPLPEAVKEERLARLLDRVGELTRAALRSWQGRKVSVLLRSPDTGRTAHHFNARLDEPGVPGSAVDAVVTGATDTALKCSAKIALARRERSVVEY